ncbi:MAG: FtsX-like permease family protein [Longimicrobiales bacterium]
MNAQEGSGTRLSRLFRRLLPGDLGAEICDTLDRRRAERRERLGAVGSGLWHAAHLLHPQVWVLAILLRRRGSGAHRRGWGPGVSWLDVKLGLRMLRRSPALTLVSVVALSIGIPTSLIPIHAIDRMGAPLPFDQADRIVGIWNWNVAEGRPDLRSLHDYAVWRNELTTFEVLGASRGGSFNVISDDGRAAPVDGAEVTASSFRIARVPPALGRTLLESDERPGASDVVVISHELWQARMGGDPDILGSTIGIGSRPHEIVGVMPEEFLFPWRDHLWLPMRERPTDFERGAGPQRLVFGRLADGASIDDARTELETVGARLAAAYPETHDRLQPQVMGYTEMAWGRSFDRVGFYSTQLVAFALLLVVCGNVGTLILARTASRSGEIAVRTALGASRSRIVSQLFVESLVLAVGSAAVGLVLADVVAGRFQSALPFELPFWMDFGVSLRTVAFTLSVAAFCAVVAGVLPALRATGRGMGASLQHAAARSRMHFGRASTLLIVAEVAMAVGFLTVGGTLTYALVEHGAPASEIDPTEYLMAGVDLPWTDDGGAVYGFETPAFRERVARVVTEMQERLAAEPGVRGVAMGSRLPRMEHPARRVEIDGEDRGEGTDGHRIRVATVHLGFFEGLGGEVRLGRDFDASDLTAPSDAPPTAVIVNTAFVEHVLGGRNPLGRRVRYVARGDREPGPWHEIVGVVGHLGVNTLTSRDEGMYHPAAPGDLYPVWIAVRLGGDPLAFAPRLRRIASDVDPETLVRNPAVLSQAPNLDRTVNLYSYLLLIFLCAVTLSLSAAGLYALMSFTVSQRTREIGIRTALGARPERILVAVARRAAIQLMTGIATGAAVGMGLLYSLRGAGIPGPDPAVTLVVCSASMLLVGLLACLAPALRALRIQPAEALGEG